MAKQGRLCGVCGKPHYGRCPELVNRIRREPVAERQQPYPYALAIPLDGGAVTDELVSQAVEPEPVVEAVARVGAKGFAPEGQCAWCDTRRAYIRDRMRANREKRRADNAG